MKFVSDSPAFADVARTRERNIDAIKRNVIDKSDNFSLPHRRPFCCFCVSIWGFGRSFRGCRWRKSSETLNWKNGKRERDAFHSLLLSRKIKVSKAELNLNVDRQMEIFQSAVKGKKTRELSWKQKSSLRAQSLKLSLTLSRRFSLAVFYKHSEDYRRLVCQLFDLEVRSFELRSEPWSFTARMSQPHFSVLSRSLFSDYRNFRFELISTQTKFRWAEWRNFVWKS